MITIEVQNLTTSSIDEEFVKRVVLDTLQYAGIKGTISVGIAIVGSATIQKLNKKYNDANRATDVLSFSSIKKFITPEHMGKYLGEIIVCPSIVRKNAIGAHVSFMRELAHVVIHGTLHLLGHDHEDDERKAEAMHAMEEKIMEQALYGK